MRQMAQAVVKSSDELVRRQADIWQQTIQAAHAQWEQVTTASRRQLEAGLSGALQKSVHEHAAQLSQSAEASQQTAERIWDRLLHALSENAQVMRAQQAEMAKQGDCMLQMARAAGDIVRLEDALNHNLQALAGARNFEATVMSLSAAIHLLNSRLNDERTGLPRVTLNASKAEGRAA